MEPKVKMRAKVELVIQVDLENQNTELDAKDALVLLKDEFTAGIQVDGEYLDYKILEVEISEMK
jgi:hypothetical protein